MTERARPGWPVYAGMSVAGAAAVVASASTLAGLANRAGWAGWTPWLLPAALDVGGSVGGWCWLRTDAPAGARRFGRSVALLGAAGSLVGNAAGHLLATGYLQSGPALVVVVGAVPAGVLVALAHLAALLASDEHQSDAEPTAQRASTTSTEVGAPATDTFLETGSTGGDTRAAVLAAVRQRPLTVGDLVAVTGRSRTTVVGHLTALARAGSVTRDDGKRYRAVTRPHLIEGTGR